MVSLLSVFRYSPRDTEETAEHLVVAYSPTDVRVGCDLVTLHSESFTPRCSIQISYTLQDFGDVFRKSRNVFFFL